ncbi:MAG: hypothetical protein NW214_06185 [Pseudanabaenaceae cyanobacterium bins.39]|nr:hypothetical protein [Pseudanabaenaceae cyanobacterium bins.39]
MLLRIEKDIQDIQQAIADVVSRIDVIHADYAQAITKAVQQQILLAAFKFCTQERPAAFLALTLAEKQGLQEALRQEIKRLCEQMQVKLEGCDRDQRTNQENLDQFMAQSLNDCMTSLNQLLVKHRILEALPEGEKSQLPQMNIRLSEIEFTDRHVMSYRGELRVLSARLAHLHKELEKKYVQKTIAEAELAWRSAWVEA